MRKTKPMTVSLPKELAEKVDELADSQNMTRSELLRASFRNYLESELKEKKMMRKMSDKAKELGIGDLDDVEQVERDMRKRSSKVVMENGQIIKVEKDKNGVIEKEVLTKEWTDWIDYWAVDFDYESKKEIVRVGKNGESEEVWTGNYLFENEWQSFRTKQDRELELTSIEHEYDEPGRYKIAVRVVDILGQDTLQIVEVGV